MKDISRLIARYQYKWKNKVPMAELKKQGFEKLNYTEVKTYLNSSNVIFSGVMKPTQSCLQARLKK